MPEWIIMLVYCLKQTMSVASNTYMYFTYRWSDELLLTLFVLVVQFNASKSMFQWLLKMLVSCRSKFFSLVPMNCLVFINTGHMKEAGYSRYLILIILPPTQTSTFSIQQPRHILQGHIQKKIVPSLSKRSYVDKKRRENLEAESYYCWNRRILV